MVQFCSLQNTKFCTRVFLLSFIVAVLLIQVCLIWNYYFTLVMEMEMELNAVPILAGVWNYCNQTVRFHWNVDCIQTENGMDCQTVNTQVDRIYYINENVSVDPNGSFRLEKNFCSAIMVWALPRM
jgi:hypothetical protein